MKISFFHFQLLDKYPNGDLKFRYFGTVVRTHTITESLVLLSMSLIKLLQALPCQE